MTKEETIHFANCLKNNWTIDFNDMADFCDTVITELNREIPTRKVGRWLVNKERDMVCCPFCMDKQKIGEAEVRLLDTIFAGFRYCRYCGAMLVGGEVVNGN